MPIRIHKVNARLQIELTTSTATREVGRAIGHGPSYSISTLTDPATTMCGGGASHDACAAANDTSGDARRSKTAIAEYTVRANARDVAMLLGRVE